MQVQLQITHIFNDLQVLLQVQSTAGQIYSVSTILKP